MQISVAGADAYQREAGSLAAMYGELLGMERYDPGYVKIARPDRVLPEIGFEDDGGAGEPRPRWPDPEHPQQAHLDIEVADLDAAESVVVRLGASRLKDCGDFRVFADPVRHPFCLYPNPALSGLSGRIARVVFDCSGPHALARFYEDLLEMHRRVVDTPDRVVIAGHEEDTTMLAFQHARFRPARWPDPAHPAQLHLDLSFEDAAAASATAERLGATLLAGMPLHAVYADPASHPFCLSRRGGEDEEGWRAEHWAKRKAR